jgi:hypothetical protein
LRVHEIEALVLAQMRDGQVASDHEQPAPKRPTRAQLVGPKRLEDLREGLLGGVLGLVTISEEYAHVAVDAIEVAHVEHREGLAVARLDVGN